MTGALKEQVLAFWDAASCGEIYAEGASPAEQYESQARARFAHEPYIREFADFPGGAGKDVLEIGVGMGADHVEWARSNPRSLHGIDLTPRAIAHTQTRLQFLGLTSNLQPADAEQLPFPDGSFDIVYSWGVLHHSPDTAAAVREVRRVLRPGGIAKVMIYNRRSILATMLWVRYALLAGKPTRSFASVLAEHLESPGTKGYTVAEAREMFSGFTHVHVETRLSFGDLLEGEVGQRHRGPLLRIAKMLWPRVILRRFFKWAGNSMFISATK